MSTFQLKDPLTVCIQTSLKDILLEREILGFIDVMNDNEVLLELIVQSTKIPQRLPVGILFRKCINLPLTVRFFHVWYLDVILHKFVSLGS